MMMKRTCLTWLLLLVLGTVSAQQTTIITRLTAMRMPLATYLKKDSSGHHHHVPTDSSFRLMVSLWISQPASGNTIHLTVGHEKNSAEISEQTLELSYRHNNRETLYAYTSDKHHRELGYLQGGYLQLYLTVPMGHLHSIKWLSATIKSDNHESEKKYYEFQ